jgi:methionyl-tRNA formyltransferase
MGTPEFAVPVLKALLDQDYQVRAVVTQPDRPQGRGKRVIPSPVKQLAQERKVRVLQPEKASDPAFREEIRGMAPDLIIVVAFGQLLKRSLLDLPGWGVINIHASLLPKLRGAAPIEWAIINDEPVTGLTLMRMDEGMDTGPVLLQEEVPVLPDETAGHLRDRLSLMAGEFIVKGLRRMAEGSVLEKTQNGHEATYAPKIERDTGLVDWTRSGDEVSALIRGLDPKPGAFTTWNNQELKLYSSTVIDRKRGDAIPGRVLGMGKGCLVVEASHGAVGIREMQVPGRRRLPVADLLRGFSIPEGSVLGKG